MLVKNPLLKPLSYPWGRPLHRCTIDYYQIKTNSPIKICISMYTKIENKLKYVIEKKTKHERIKKYNQ